MSDHRDCAAWCEHADGRSVAIVCFPSSIALYPANLIELARALTLAAIDAAR